MLHESDPKSKLAVHCHPQLLPCGLVACKEAKSSRFLHVRAGSIALLFFVACRLLLQ